MTCVWAVFIHWSGKFNLALADTSQSWKTGIYMMSKWGHWSIPKKWVYSLIQALGLLPSLSGYSTLPSPAMDRTIKHVTRKAKGRTQAKVRLCGEFWVVGASRDQLRVPGPAASTWVKTLVLRLICYCYLVAKSRPSLCDTMNCSISGSSVLHYLPDFP